MGSKSPPLLFFVVYEHHEWLSYDTLTDWSVGEITRTGKPDSTIHKQSSSPMTNLLHLDIKRLQTFAMNFKCKVCNQELNS